MKKFDLKKIEKELRDINKENDIKTTAGIQLILNNIMLYNDLVDLYESGEMGKVYILYQLTGSIFKQLDKYNIYPDSTKEKITKSTDYVFDKIKNKVEKR